MERHEVVWGICPIRSTELGALEIFGTLKPWEIIKNKGNSQRTLPAAPNIGKMENSKIFSTLSRAIDRFFLYLIVSVNNEYEQKSKSLYPTEEFIYKMLTLEG